jgi:hypothetical protein
MYLGGPLKQHLIDLPLSVHLAYHSGLDGILPRQKGKSYYDSLTGSARQQMFTDLADYTRGFDTIWGTSLYNAMKAEGAPVP